MNTIKEITQRKTTEHWENFLEKIEHDFHGWKLVRRQRAKLKELVKVKHVIKDTWITYFR